MTAEGDRRVTPRRALLNRLSQTNCSGRVSRFGKVDEIGIATRQRLRVCGLKHLVQIGCRRHETSLRLRAYHEGREIRQHWPSFPDSAGLSPQRRIQRGTRATASTPPVKQRAGRRVAKVFLPNPPHFCTSCRRRRRKSMCRGWPFRLDSEAAMRIDPLKIGNFEEFAWQNRGLCRRRRREIQR